MEQKISYTNFAKLDLRVGKILSLEPHPNADKLYVLKVDLGEEEPRTIVAGLKPYYTKSQLLNKKAIFVTNLEPKEVRGIESNGMILAASSKDKVIFLTTESDIEQGAKIK